MHIHYMYESLNLLPLFPAKTKTRNQGIGASAVATCNRDNLVRLRLSGLDGRNPARKPLEVGS